MNLQHSAILIGTIIFTTSIAQAAPTQAHSGNPQDTIIHMSENGYMPQDITIKQGDIVTFENTSSNELWPASNIHPTHAIYSDFDPKQPIPSGQSWRFRFDNSGTWNYHDHLFPDISGTITVQADQDPNTPQEHLAEPSPESSPSKTANINIDSILLTLTKFYYRLFPNKLEQRLADLNFNQLAQNQTEIRYWLELIGIKDTIQKLLNDTNGGNDIDCHQAAHLIGRTAFEIFDKKLFQEGDASCHSGFYHGGMEAFLAANGTSNLAQNISALCNSFETSFGNFECLHGVGHGIMALENYHLPKALTGCQLLQSDFETSSCYGGVFMENVIADIGLGALPGHQTKWISDDPHFPCSGVSQDELTQVQCYQMQTSRMLVMFDYDFSKVSTACEDTPQEYIPACFLSLGRDAAGFTLRDPQKTNTICQSVPREHFQSCLTGSLNVIVDFWGDNMTDQPHKLCEIQPNPEDKVFCYQLLARRLVDVFGDNTEEIAKSCSYAKEHQELCRQTAEI